MSYSKYFFIFCVVFQPSLYTFGLRIKNGQGFFRNILNLSFAYNRDLMLKNNVEMLIRMSDFIQNARRQIKMMVFCTNLCNKVYTNHTIEIYVDI